MDTLYLLNDQRKPRVRGFSHDSTPLPLTCDKRLNLKHKRSIENVSVRLHELAAKHILVRIRSAKEASRQAWLFHDVWPMLSFECALGDGSCFRKSTTTPHEC